MAAIYLVRITIGSNLIDYPNKLTTHTADLNTNNIMWHSVISTDDAKYLCADINSSYLETQLDWTEHMRMLLDIVPEELQEAYGPKEKAKIGFVYMEIQKVMYGLPQSVILANKLFNKRLTELGYFEMLHTLGLWKHVSRPIAFTLVVNDFGNKYVGREHAEHLMQ